MAKMAIDKKIRKCVCSKHEQSSFHYWRIRLGSIRLLILLILLIAALTLWKDTGLWTYIVGLGALYAVATLVKIVRGHSLLCALRTVGLYVLDFMGSPMP